MPFRSNFDSPDQTREKTASGLFFGLLLSIPDAIITKAYAPIIGMGALGGIIIGVIIGRFGQ